MQKPILRRLLSTSLAVAAAISISAPSMSLAQGPGGAPAGEEQAANTFAPGDKAPAFSTEGLVWLKGDEIAELNEPGKVYMIECWATWCGPCIASIPHINELHTKFADKGLVVVGMNVFEDGLEPIKKFVDEQGDKMSYRVAYSGGRGSEFQKTWLDAAGVNGIPHAFIVKDGMLVTTSHPAAITDEMVTEFLSDDFDAAAFGKKKAAEEARQQEINQKVSPFFENEDWKGLKEFVTKELTQEGDKELRDQLLYMASVNLGDWAAIQAHAASLESSEEKEQTYGNAAFSAPTGDAAKAAAEDALNIFTAERLAATKQEQETLMVGLVRLRYLSLAEKQEDAEALLKTLDEKELSNPQMAAMVDNVLDKVTALLEAGEPVGPIGPMMR